MQASYSKGIIVQIQLDVFEMSVVMNSALCFVSVEEKADPSIPLYVLPLYSLLAPEKQAKVRLLSYVSTKLKETAARNIFKCFISKFTLCWRTLIYTLQVYTFPAWILRFFKSAGREGGSHILVCYYTFLITLFLLVIV